MIRPPSMFVEAIKVVALAAMLPLQSFGCGVEWKVPKDHFDGVNEYGYVSYWDKIGDLDLGDGLSIPLVIGFQSDREWSSPYLGYGWILPLFDSNLVQTGENSFEMIAPDGYTVQFGRDGKNPTLINGQRGLKGEIKGDTITLWADCGWKMCYNKGKIVSIGTPKGKTLVIGRDEAGFAKDLTYDSRVVVKIEKSGSGVVTGLQLGDRYLGIEQVEKPRIQSIQGKNLVAGKDLSFGKVSSEDRALKTFEYGLTEKLEPKMSVTDQGKPPREITWDPITRIIKTDGVWTYNIKPSENHSLNASIGRRNKINQEELWFLDSAKGEETVQTLDRSKKITTWFTSGKLAGKPRKTLQHGELGEQILNEYVYNETGRIIRKKANELTTIYTYGSNGSLENIETNQGWSIRILSKRYEAQKYASAILK